MMIRPGRSETARAARREFRANTDAAAAMEVAAKAQRDAWRRWRRAM